MSNSDGVVCTQEEITRSDLGSTSSSPSLHCLTRAQSIGLAFDVEIGVISAATILFLFLMAFRTYVRNRCSGSKQALIERPMDLYVHSLFVFDVLQALGGAVSAKWVYEGKVYTGPYCTMQGAVQQLGETGVAITILVIALHTFSNIWWRKSLDNTLMVARIVVCVIWVFVGLFVIIGVASNTKNHNFYETPTPDWCWIGQKYTGERIAGEYIWIWLAMVLSIVLYLPLFFLLRGNIEVDEDKWWKFCIHRRVEKQIHYKQSTAVLAYPLVYSLTVLPMTIGRWIQFSHPNATSATASVVPTSFSFFGECMYLAGGACDVLLFAVTRPKLLIFGTSNQTVSTGKAPSIISLDNDKASATGTDDIEAGIATAVINVEDADAEAVERLRGSGLYRADVP